jgi:hypothetical protein
MGSMVEKVWSEKRWVGKSDAVYALGKRWKRKWAEEDGGALFIYQNVKSHVTCCD